MSSGNPMGLSEISHFGTFQRVGGKAGGFISKKFFHPSSFRNQEKLWKAQTADERESRKQGELERRREEERQVEALKKQMYLSGQGKATDFVSNSAAAEEAAAAEKAEGGGRDEQKHAVEEQQRRKALVRQQARASGSSAAHSSSTGKLAASRYDEDVRVLNHVTAWGSWYSTEEKRWGFACCKGLEREANCPLAPAAPAQAETGKAGKAAAGGEAAAAAADAAAAPAGGLVVPGRGADAQEKAEKARERAREKPSWLGKRLLEAEERKRRKLEAERAEKAAEDPPAEAPQDGAGEEAGGYLANLLQEPSR